MKDVIDTLTRLWKMAKPEQKKPFEVRQGELNLDMAVRLLGTFIFNVTASLAAHLLGRFHLI